MNFGLDGFVYFERGDLVSGIHPSFSLKKSYFHGLTALKTKSLRVLEDCQIVSFTYATTGDEYRDREGIGVRRSKGRGDILETDCRGI